MKRTQDHKKKPFQSVASSQITTSFLQTRGFGTPQTNSSEDSSVQSPSRYSENFLERLISQPASSDTSIQTKATNHFKPLQSKRMAIQAKLNIGAPNDKYEQEADRTAAQVLQQINLPPQDNSVQRHSALEKKEQIQAKFSPPKFLMPKLQRRTNSAEEEASTNLESSIQRMRGRGQSLEPNLQLKMGQAMGADFSNVKVHTDSESDQLNQSIQAKAFTTGQDVFFRQGQYNPTSSSGQELIAHELTHVMQQSGAQASNSQQTIHKAPDQQIQRLVSREDFVSLAGGPSTVARFNSSTYTKILQYLKQAESEENEDRKKTIHENIKNLCEKWLDSHSEKMGGKGGSNFTYLPKGNSEADDTKVIHIAGLLKEVSTALGEDKIQIGGQTPSEIITQAREEKEALVSDINAEEAKASEGANSYKLTLLASVQNPYLIDFAKKRLALTIENKRKLRSKNKKSNDDIKNEAAKQVLMEKESEKFAAMKSEEQLEAIKKLAEASSAVGHTWINLATLNAEKSLLNKHSFGFYPKEFYNQPTVPVPGEVVYPDNVHTGDPTQLAVDYDLNKTQYSQALDFAKKQRQSPPQYQLTGYNCTFFAKKVVEAAGQAFPGNAFMTVPTGAVSAITGLGKDKAFNPNALYDALNTYDGKDGNPQSYVPERIEKKKELTAFEKIYKCVLDWQTDKFTLNQDIQEKYASGGSSKQTFKSGTEIKITDAYNGRIDNEVAISKVDSKDDEHWFDADILYNAIADQVMATIE